MRHSISFVTPILPSRSLHLRDCITALETLGAGLESEGISSEWITVVDGPGTVDIPDWAETLRLPVRSGPAVARNLGLAASRCDWIFPIDADDMVEPQCASLLAEFIKGAPPSVGWLATNRVLIGGAKTPHWFNLERHWMKGELAEEWSSPFPFHPNSVIFRRDHGLRIGGWPATPTVEDMAFVLFLSEYSQGVAKPIVTLNYRTWEGQQVRESSYDSSKNLAFKLIAKVLNAKRELDERNSVTAPNSSGSPGIDSLEGPLF